MRVVEVLTAPRRRRMLAAGFGTGTRADMEVALDRARDALDRARRDGAMLRKVGRPRLADLSAALSLEDGS